MTSLSGTDDWSTVRLLKNGAIIASNTSYAKSTGSPNVSVEISTLVPLNGTTDYITVSAINSTTKNLDGAASSTYFEGHLVSSATTASGGTGTANFVPKWTDSTTLGNSVIAESSGNVGIGTTNPLAKLEVAGAIKPGGATTGAACSPEGAFAYDASAHSPIYCSQSAVWTAMGGGSGGGSEPAGAIMAFSQTSCPTGWLQANGSAISRTTYSTLFTAIATMYGAGDGSTTFNLPDYRGYFLRGWANGAANDPDRASRTNRGDGTGGDVVGSKQADELKSHSHTYSNIASSYWFSGSGPGSASDNYDVTYGTPSTTATGGNESRPKNINVLYCIKI